MAKNPETELLKELTAVYLQNFTATYLNKLAVFNNLDLSTLDTKAKVVEALSEYQKFVNQKISVSGTFRGDFGIDYYNKLKS